MSSLVSSFRSIVDNRDVTTLANDIEEPLTLQTDKLRNIIDFANYIMKQMCHKVEQHLRYNLNIWNKKGSLCILNKISENITLVQLMDTLWNFNNSISILRSWILDFNYEKALFLTKSIWCNILSFRWWRTSFKIWNGLLRC